MTNILEFLTARRQALEIQAAETEGALREIYALLALMADEREPPPEFGSSEIDPNTLRDMARAAKADVGRQIAKRK